MQALFRPLLILGLLTASITVAQAEGPHEFSGNVTLATEYVFRGLSQTNGDPAIQGGVDYAYIVPGWPNGITLYSGIWASNVEFNIDDIYVAPTAAMAGAATGVQRQTDDASIEIDGYVGITGEFANGIGWDVAGLYYYYPGQDEDSNTVGDYDYIEVLGILSYAFSNSLMEPAVSLGGTWSPDYLGEDDTGLYGYGSIDLTTPFYGIGISGLVGYLDVDGDKTDADGYSYVHWQIGLNAEVFGFGLDLSYFDAEDDCHEDVFSPNDGNLTSFSGEFCDGVVFSISRGI